MRADGGDLLSRRAARAVPSTSRRRARDRAARARASAPRTRAETCCRARSPHSRSPPFGQRDLERRFAAERGQVVVAPRDRVDADLTLKPGSPCGSWLLLLLAVARRNRARASRTCSRSETSGTATSHHQPPSSVVRVGIGVDADDDSVRSAARARCIAASSSAMSRTFSASAPSDARVRREVDRAARLAGLACNRRTGC